VIETVGDNIKRILLAPSPAAIDANIKAGPIISEYLCVLALLNAAQTLRFVPNPKRRGDLHQGINQRRNCEPERRGRIN
jgi:hypothetical protein